MGGWRELLHTNALRKVFRVKFSKAPERFKSQNPIFQSHLNEQEKISKENTPASRGLGGAAAAAAGTAPRSGCSPGTSRGAGSSGGSNWPPQPSPWETQGCVSLRKHPLHLCPRGLPGLGMGPSGSACRGRSRRAQGQRLALHPQQPWGHQGHRRHRRLRAQTPLGREGSPAVTGEGRAGAGNRMTPSLTPQPLQPPKSISSSPFSILMNRKGSWDPWRQQPWRLDPPKE